MELNKITDGLLQNAVFVTDDKGDVEDVGQVVSLLDSKYRKYRGKTGNTAQRSWMFFNSEGELLVKITDLGNKGLILVTIGHDSTVYRKVEDAVK